MAKTSKNPVIPWDKEEGSGRARVPEGDYRAKIISSKFMRSKEKDTPGIEVKFKISEGKRKGTEITDRLWITPKSLFRIRNLLEAIGQKVPKKASRLDLDELKGEELGITVVDGEPYNNRIASEIGDYMDLETLESGGVDDDDEDEDEEDEDTDDEEEDEEMEDLDVDDDI